LSDELGECCGACSALSLPLINDLQNLDTKIDKDTQVIDSKYRRCIENPRVGGSIPPLGTIFQPGKNHHTLVYINKTLNPLDVRA
jgi:hypothetical protein